MSAWQPYGSEDRYDFLQYEDEPNLTPADKEWVAARRRAAASHILSGWLLWGFVWGIVPWSFLAIQIDSDAWRIAFFAMLPVALIAAALIHQRLKLGRIVSFMPYRRNITLDTGTVYGFIIGAALYAVWFMAPRWLHTDLGFLQWLTFILPIVAGKLVAERVRASLR